MNKMKQPLKIFYTTALHPCGYFPDRSEAQTAVDLSGMASCEWANVLSRSGFRRSGNICYIPSCPKCRACVPVRIKVNEFVFSQTMKKVVRRNHRMRSALLPNVATTEQYALFKSYLSTRHTGGEMEKMQFEEYRAMIEDSPVETRLIEWRDEDSLTAVMLADVLDDGLSAVYSFFDAAQSKRSLGTFMILEVIRLAKEKNLPYVYLGYLIRELPNMAYKERFQPLEYYRNGKWSASLSD